MTFCPELTCSIIARAKRLRLAIFQVEAVMKLLSSEVNLRLVAPQCRQPIVKRGTLARAVIAELRRSAVAMTPVPQIKTGD
jgi:hypothetical protein